MTAKKRFYALFTTTSSVVFMSIGITYEQFCFKRGDTFNLNLQLVDMDDALQYPANDVRRAIDLTGIPLLRKLKLWMEPPLQLSLVQL
ncbi:hypothetical protein BANRA_03376 [Acinetobacter baumannii]|nr:hypothetical protein BANRA_03376 [Acinetobacter baumannii]